MFPAPSRSAPPRRTTRGCSRAPAPRPPRLGAAGWSRARRAPARRRRRRRSRGAAPGSAPAGRSGRSGSRTPTRIVLSARTCRVRWVRAPAVRSVVRHLRPGATPRTAGHSARGQPRQLGGRAPAERGVLAARGLTHDPHGYEGDQKWRPRIADRRQLRADLRGRHAELLAELPVHGFRIALAGFEFPAGKLPQPPVSLLRGRWQTRRRSPSAMTAATTRITEGTSAMCPVARQAATPRHAAARPRRGLARSPVRAPERRSTGGPDPFN